MLRDIPDGYGTWLHEMEKAAMQGWPVLLEAWRRSDAEYQCYALVSGRACKLLNRAISKAKEPPPMLSESWHGTHGGYTNHKCRCTECRLAHNCYVRMYKRRARLAKGVTHV